MLTEHMIKNAIDMALEEIIEIDNVTEDDFKNFRKRFNNLMDQLEEEIDSDE